VTVRRLATLAVLTSLVVAACGASTSKEPPALLFVSVKDGDYAVFGADADAKHVWRLSKDKGDPSGPAGLLWQIEPSWSPDGKRIAFASHRDGTSHIFSMRPDGTDTRRLTSSRQDDGHPSWSADGRWIVFGREGALFRIPAAGGAAHRVGKGLGNAQNPAYSPDGKLIAYDYRRPGYSIREIYVMRADGTGIRRLTHVGAVSSFPTWSPDGKRIAFVSDALDGRSQIYAVAPGGGKVQRIVRTSGDAIQPSWSPDGSKIAFSLDGAIWVAGRGTETQLTSGEDNDSNPVWRPE
jgi:TolB protein